MFTIFGASGNTGSVVAGRLLDRGQRVRAVVRDPARAEALRARGAEVVVADVTDRQAVVDALAGADGAYLLIPPDVRAPDFLARGRRIVDNYVAGLTAHRVPHAALLSSRGAQAAGDTGLLRTVHDAEARLPEAAATRFTFVRPGSFMENLLAYAHPMRHDGVLPVFGGGETQPLPMVATRDIGEVAAAALLAPPAATERIELSGPRAYSYADAAAEASRILGRPVVATAMPLDALAPALTAVGFGAGVAALYREMVAAFAGGLGFEGGHRDARGEVTLGEVLRGGLA